MQGMDPLAGLKPLHAPAPIPWWPPAPGWWLVLLVLLLSLALAIRWWRIDAPRRAALRELKALASRGEQGAGLAAALNRLLKRYALVCWPATRTAALSGESWLAFLDANGGNGAFTRGPGRALLTLPYAGETSDSDVAVESAALLQQVRRWIKANRPRGKHR